MNGCQVKNKELIDTTKPCGAEGNHSVGQKLSLGSLLPKIPFICITVVITIFIVNIILYNNCCSLLYIEF